MGIVKQHQLQEFDEAEAQRDREFAMSRPDLVAEGWDRETWEEMMRWLEHD